MGHLTTTQTVNMARPQELKARVEKRGKAVKGTLEEGLTQEDVIIGVSLWTAETGIKVVV